MVISVIKALIRVVQQRRKCIGKRHFSVMVREDPPEMTFKLKPG